MKYSDLAPKEKEFFTLLKEAEQRGPADYIAIVSLLCTMKNKDLEGFAERYTRGDFKRAVKQIREVQKGLPEYAASYENAVTFIRQHWLHRDAVLV